MNTFITRTSGTMDPMKTIYVPFSMSDACVFHSLFLLSARSFAKVSADTSYHITALAHKTGCIRLVNEALGIPGKRTSIGSWYVTSRIVASGNFVTRTAIATTVVTTVGSLGDARLEA